MRVAAIMVINPPESLVPFAEACLRFSPQICLKRSGSVFIEIGKCKTLYDEKTFLLRLQVLLKRFKLKAKMALAETLLDALILTRYGSLDLKEIPLTSLHEYRDPFGADLDSLKKTEEMIKQLEQMGLRCIYDFLKIPTSQLASRFGALGLLTQSHILNGLEVEWPYWKPIEKILEATDLFDHEECFSLEPLLFYLKPLLDRAFARLWGRGLRAVRLEIIFRLEKFSTVKKPLRKWQFDFVLPQSTAQGTLPILRERLEADLRTVPFESGVQGMSLEILEAVPGYQAQRLLYQGHSKTEEDFSALFAQLAESAGKQNVFKAQIHDEAIPERSWSRAVTLNKTTPDLKDYIPLRPTRLLKKPEKIDLGPGFIFIRNRKYRVVKCSTVERIETHWLEMQTFEFDRSYFRMDLEGKPAVWVFKDKNHDYFLHGYFE